ncbi:MAG: divalent metal cation transporter [Gemmatimonadota bacterium]|nr:divalent metal cation transporter [Gemmatimonadota bacterium]
MTETEQAARPSSFWKSFGPGLVWAATSIGVSHLVQSTRAGAQAGFALVGVIVLALVLKYPFFEYGARYAAATQNSLVEGYRRIGRWALWLYLAITVVSAMIALAAVLMFTSYLTGYAFDASWPVAITGVVLLIVCMAILYIGKYPGLDLSIKIILLFLLISTLAAVAIALPRMDVSTVTLWPGDLIGTVVPFAFLLALIGWMPSPVDVAVWSSLWTLEKDKVTGGRTSVRNATRDFAIGYVGTGFLAVGFVALGAAVLYGSDVELSASGAVFSTQLVDLYSQTLGGWSRPFVLIAAVTTMFSTTLAVLDGYPRAIERTLMTLRTKGDVEVLPRSERLYWGIALVIGTVAITVLLLFVGNLTTMVDFATTVAFLTAPLLGYLNLKAVTSKDVPAEYQPARWMIGLSWIGLVLLGGTGVAYLVSLL